MVKILVKSVDELEYVAKRLADFLLAGDFLALDGELGAGKTTFVQGLAKGLEISEAITSPTFTIIKEYHDKLLAKIQDMLGDVQVDENRLLTEVTIFADKACVDEEIVRLRSHIETTKKTLQEGGSIGRKLDFIAQEMNREANTTLSKSNDLEISNCAIELKTEIEKVREQIQNIE